MTTAPPAQASIDVSGLLPPEPMEQVLEALAALPAGHTLHVLIDREPFPLYRILDRHGYRHRCAPREDYRFDLLIRQGPCSDL